MFKGANRTFLIVGFIFIIFLSWLIIKQFNISDNSNYASHDDLLQDYGLKVNIYPDGSPKKE